VQQPTLTVLTDPQRIEELAGYLADKDFVATDTETTGVHKGAIVVGISVCAELDQAFYVITHTWDGAALVPHPENIKAARKVIEALIGKSLIMHNGLFDCEKIEINYGIRLIDFLHTDNMVLAHLLNPDRLLGLKPLATAYYGADSTKEAEEMKASVLANGGIWTEDNKEMYKADSQLLGKYGAQDAYLTLRLFYDLVEELYAQGLDKFFYEDESMPLLRGSTYELNTTGLKVDLQKLQQLKLQLEAECAEAKTFIHSEIAPLVAEKYPGTNKRNTFNIGASQQLAWLLFGKMGLEFGTLTKGGKVICRAIGISKLPYVAGAKRDFIHQCQQSVGQVYEAESIVNGKKKRAKKVKEPWAYIQADAKTLKKYAPKYKWVDKLLEYNKKMKLLSTYVEGIQERVDYGIIHPSFLQHGTKSGRYASRNPNFQNLPRDDKRIKSCIIARPGKSFVGADYSQLEPRVFSYYSNDTRLLASFQSADDFYSVIGMDSFDKYDCIPRKEGSADAFGVKYKKLRGRSQADRTGLHLRCHRLGDGTEARHNRGGNPPDSRSLLRKVSRCRSTTARQPRGSKAQWVCHQHVRSPPSYPRGQANHQDSRKCGPRRPTLPRPQAS
jgi:DNA polymerase I-like protein with 3'-5' exonuclease and polymerase domains